MFNRQEESEFETNRFRPFQQHNDVVTREGLTISPGDTKNLCRWMSLGKSSQQCSKTRDQLVKHDDTIG
jgi:hypothetical protein